jgi:hypothetical protein
MTGVRRVGFEPGPYLDPVESGSENLVLDELYVPQSSDTNNRIKTSRTFRPSDERSASN